MIKTAQNNRKWPKWPKNDQNDGIWKKRPKTIKMPQTDQNDQQNVEKWPDDKKGQSF